MAVYPCDFGKHRYPQAQQSIYFTHVIGRTADTYKLRECPTHFRSSWTLLQEMLAELDENSQTSNTCDTCGETAIGSIFAKVFPAHEEFRQYVGDFCASHMASLGDRLKITNGSHFTGPVRPLDETQ